jgi:microcystin-dependent protein
MHPGQGQGLSLHDLGESAGEEFVTLIDSENPVHIHGMRAQTVDNADITNVTNMSAYAPSVGGTLYQGASNGNMAFQALPPAGGSLPHNNMQPYLTLNFCIALQGIFPSRN